MMVNPKDLMGHAYDLWDLAFSQKSRVKRYTKDNFPDTRLTVRCEKAPWLTHSSYDTNQMIDMAFDFSERYPDTWIDLEFTDDGLLYFSFLNGSIQVP